MKCTNSSEQYLEKSDKPLLSAVRLPGGDSMIVIKSLDEEKEK